MNSLWNYFFTDEDASAVASACVFEGEARCWRAQLRTLRAALAASKAAQGEAALDADTAVAPLSIADVQFTADAAQATFSELAAMREWSIVLDPQRPERCEACDARGVSARVTLGVRSAQLAATQAHGKRAASKAAAKAAAARARGAAVANRFAWLCERCLGAVQHGDKGTLRAIRARAAARAQEAAQAELAEGNGSERSTSSSGGSGDSGSDADGGGVTAAETARARLKPLLEHTDSAAAPPATNFVRRFLYSLSMEEYWPAFEREGLATLRDVAAARFGVRELRELLGVRAAHLRPLATAMRQLEEHTERVARARATHAARRVGAHAHEREDEATAQGGAPAAHWRRVRRAALVDALHSESDGDDDVRSEANSSDEESDSEASSDSSRSSGTGGGGGGGDGGDVAAVRARRARRRVRVGDRVRALHAHASDVAGELQLRRGAIVRVLERSAEADGWWLGEDAESGAVGLFPANFTEPLERATRARTAHVASSTTGTAGATGTGAAEGAGGADVQGSGSSSAVEAKECWWHATHDASDRTASFCVRVAPRATPASAAAPRAPLRIELRAIFHDPADRELESEYFLLLFEEFGKLLAEKNLLHAT